MAAVATVCPEWKGRLRKKEYRDWLSVGHALSTMCEGVRPFISREMKTFHTSLCTTLATKPPCCCAYAPARKRNPWHDLSKCAWANELMRFHRGHKPRWHQSDSTKWMDPADGPWEIAKLYMSDLGSHSASVVDVNTTDPTGLLNLVYWCDAFKVQQVLVKDVRETRNTKWGHAARQELSVAETKVAFKAIRDLLQDPELVADPDAQSALADVVALETTELVDFEEIEFKVIKDSLNSTNDKIDEILSKIDTFELVSSINSLEITKAILDIKELIHLYMKRNEEKSTSSATASEDNPETCKLKKILNIFEERVESVETDSYQYDAEVVSQWPRPIRLNLLHWVWKRWALVLCILCCFIVLNEEKIESSG